MPTRDDAMNPRPLLIAAASALLFACTTEAVVGPGPGTTTEDGSSPADARVGGGGDASWEAGTTGGPDAADSSTGKVDGGNRFPFPQNSRAARCTYAAGADP